MVTAFPVERLLRPRSIAIVGVSPDVGSMGGRALANIDRFGFAGDIHLVSRSNAKIGDRFCVPTIDELPDGVDAMVLALPAAGVLQAVEAAARRRVGGMVVFAAGFSETGPEGRLEQDRIAATAREAGIALLGPNTLGLTNYVDGIPLGFGPNEPNPPAKRPTLAAIAQSGAMAASMRLSSLNRGLAISYSVATGNEAVTGVEDYLAAFVDDPATHAIAIFAEQLRKPRLFLELAQRARENGKPIILLSPGKSQRARDSAASHTGALSGDYATMRAMVESEAVVAVETLEEFLDAAEMLTRFPRPSIKGPAIITDSGAFKGLALDFSETIELPLPDVTDTTATKLGQRLPRFAALSNPLDITAQGLKDMPLYEAAARIMLEDDASGGLIVALMPGSPDVGKIKSAAVLPTLSEAQKPIAYVVLGGAAPVAPDLERTVLNAGVPFFRSPERALRAFGHLHKYANAAQRAAVRREPMKARAALIPGTGILLEYAGKTIIAAAGLRVPDGRLTTSVEDAVTIAGQIGWPVVLKAQSAELPHKTEAGGVLVGVKDEAALRAGWEKVTASVAKAKPGLALDGLLVEAMGPPGLELVVGGRNDPAWGPLLVFGLGGVWIEALKDVRLVRADASRSRIVDELKRLRGALLLNGYRGSPPIDLDAVADAIGTVGDLLCTHGEIAEIDINPLMAFPKGIEPLVLDTLIVLGGPAHKLD